MPKHKELYERNLPHHQPEYATYSIVFPLAGSLPASVAKRVKQEHIQFESVLSGINDETKGREAIVE